MIHVHNTAASSLHTAGVMRTILRVDDLLAQSLEGHAKHLHLLVHQLEGGLQVSHRGEAGQAGIGRHTNPVHGTKQLLHGADVNLVLDLAPVVLEVLGMRRIAGQAGRQAGGWSAQCWGLLLFSSQKRCLLVPEVMYR
jgi:hypothetical protein